MPKIGRFYFIHYPPEIRFRNIWRMKGNEFEPLIQMEAKLGSEWSPIIRCDRSHNFLHLDLLYRNGEKKKLELQSRDSSDAIVEVIEILKQDGKIFEELGYPDIAAKFAKNQEPIKTELENAKRFLLAESKHPEKMVDMRGKGVIACSMGADLVRKSEEGKS